MSGGFFRGTSADQDTRFSNKQAKLLKSQKFAPELDNLVDMTRVKIDVLRPWIAKRVTELLGFEDEVLINFIYGLLDGKNVNGKEIQISLTGFMEKNTGKFMKELWTHLLSAQKNTSGVPQQFLDEKEEETRKKMADAERITNEIHRKKVRDAEESEHFRKKMEGGSDPSRTTVTDDNLLAKNRNGRSPSYSPGDRKKIAGRNGGNIKARRSGSSHSAESSPSPNRLRSISRSPKTRKRSISSERTHHNRKRSISPYHVRSYKGSPSPSRRRLSYRRRSRSRSYSSSSSPQPRRSFRRASPHPHAPRTRQRRSPSSVRRWSKSPIRRRIPSPIQRRSSSPVRRRSRLRRLLVRRKLPSPVLYSSPLSSPLRGSMSSLSQGTSPSPRRALPPPRRRSPSKDNLHSPRRRRTPCPEVLQQSLSTPRHRHSSPGSRGPLVLDSKKHYLSDSSPPSPCQSIPESPVHRRSNFPSREKALARMSKQISLSSVENSSQKNRTGRESHGQANSGNVQRKVSSEAISPEQSHLSSESPANTNGFDQDELISRRKESKVSKESLPQATRESNSSCGNLEIRDKTSGRTNRNAKEADLQKMELLPDHKIKTEGGDQHVEPENEARKPAGTGLRGDRSDPDRESGKKRKHKGSSRRHEVTSDDDSSESEADEKKDVKRRRKEDKRLRREKRRQRHVEKRHKKEERCGGKHHLKSRKYDDAGIGEKIHDKSDGEEEEKKKLEVELRKKALESLKAKKGIGQ
uniref:PWI domain-containing protein n=1 Tax=Kalanchoe fedtschenkoi TaxID=63787 RepID=A0A7N0UP71_KALFE